MHDDQSRLPALIKAGPLHVQFETIHPYLDGNGRIGRSIIVKARVAHPGPMSFMKTRQNDFPEKSASLHLALSVGCSGERIHCFNDRLQISNVMV